MLRQSNARSRCRKMAALRINNEITIEDWELTERFVRSAGPGGQNVNKLATAVELRFDAERSPNLHPAVKARLKRLAGRRWAQDGIVVIQADTMRSQMRNREIARDRLASLIRKSVPAPRPRVPTKPTKASQQKRIAAKKMRGSIKAARARIDCDE